MKCTVFRSVCNFFLNSEKKFWTFSVFPVC